MICVCIIHRFYTAYDLCLCHTLLQYIGFVQPMICVYIMHWFCTTLSEQNSFRCKVFLYALFIVSLYNNKVFSFKPNIHLNRIFEDLRPSTQPWQPLVKVSCTLNSVESTATKDRGCVLNQIHPTQHVRCMDILCMYMDIGAAEEQQQSKWIFVDRNIEYG